MNSVIIFGLGAITGIVISMFIDVIEAKRKSKKTKDAESVEIRDNLDDNQ
jgi:hypothetical protein